MIIKEWFYKNSLIYKSWRYIRNDPFSLFGLAVIILFIFCALFADFISPYNPNHQILRDANMAPCSKYLMGTDEFAGIYFRG